MDYLLPDKAYQVLKWLCILLIPAVSWALGELLPDYGVDPYKITHLLDVIGTLVGMLIGASQVSVMGSANRDWSDE